MQNQIGGGPGAVVRSPIGGSSQEMNPVVTHRDASVRQLGANGEIGPEAVSVEFP